MLWPLVLAAAPDAQTGLDLAQLWAPILGVIGLLLTGLLTLIGTFRSSGRAAQAQRDAAQTQRDMQLDDRADKQNARLEEENTRLRAALDKRTEERDDYRERWFRLRVAVIAAGLNPDDLIDVKKGQPDAA